MNFSATSASSTIHDGCEVHDFLGRKLDHTTTVANVVLVIVTVVNIITCPFTIVLNLLVMIAVKTKARLKSNSNVALCCLAVTDVLIGALSQPIFAAETISKLQGEKSNEHCTWQRMIGTVLRILAAATIRHLVLLNVERYLAIKHTYAYTTMVTKDRILGSSALVWISVALTNIPPLLSDNHIFVAIFHILFVISMVIIVFCQVAVYTEARRHEKQIALQQVSVEARQKFLKEKKALKLTTTVLFILLLCHLPLIVVLALLRTFAITSVNITISAFLPASFLTMLNSFINPVIYCVRKRQFRVAFIEILFRKNYTQADQLERQIFGTSNIVAPLVEGQKREEAQNNQQGIRNSNDNNSGEDSKDKTNDNQINDSTRSL